MSVRKRTWKPKDGKEQQRWVVDYVDQHGKRHIKTFDRKKDADAYHASVKSMSAVARIRRSPAASPSQKPQRCG